MTTPHALHWDILRWNFDVEHVDMVLRHNVQYKASLLGLPILVLECSKWDQLEREAHQRGWKFDFFRGQMLMKWTETFTGQSQPLGPSFPPGFTPQVICHYALSCKTVSSGPKVARFCEGVKKARHGDYLTSKQNASLTVGNSRPHCLKSNQVCLLSLLLTMIWSAFSPMMRFWPFWSSSGVVREGRPELCRPDGCHQKYWWDEAENCWLLSMHFVSLSSSYPLALCLAFFTPSQNLATFGPDDTVLHDSA